MKLYKFNIVLKTENILYIYTILVFVKADNGIYFVCLLWINLPINLLTIRTINKLFHFNSFHLEISN